MKKDFISIADYSKSELEDIFNAQNVGMMCGLDQIERKNQKIYSVIKCVNHNGVVGRIIQHGLVDTVQIMEEVGKFRENWLLKEMGYV